MIRETIYAALFERLSDIAGIASAGRRLKHWGDVAPAMQPALFLVQKRELPTQRSGLPAAWTLQADLFLYVHAGSDPNRVPATALNDLLDKVETALAPAADADVQTLGGQVAHCWIDKSGIQTDEGVLGEQAVAIVPITILVP